jgi:hypothetical protein
MGVCDDGVVCDEDVGGYDDGVCICDDGGFVCVDGDGVCDNGVGGYDDVTGIFDYVDDDCGGGWNDAVLKKIWGLRLLGQKSIYTAEPTKKCN